MTSLTGSPVGVVLAAGESRRLGRDKLLEPVEGVPMVERVVHAMLGAKKVRDVVVVIPAGRVDAFSWLRSVRVHLVENPDPSRGMISSIREGLNSGWARGKDFLLCPADLPYLRSEHVDDVVRAFMARDGCLVVLPSYRGLGGHPGMFASQLRGDFFRHGDRNGTREILARHVHATVRVSLADPDVCFDVDTPDELRIAPDPSGRWAHVEKEVEERRKTRLG
jgi:molybdenum cofactor cytidylyltransferase